MSSSNSLEINLLQYIKEFSNISEVKNSYMTRVIKIMSVIIIVLLLCVIFKKEMDIIKVIYNLIM